MDEKIKNLEQKLIASIDTTNVEVKKHKEELESNDLIF
jgi:hypothetical protein